MRRRLITLLAVLAAFAPAASAHAAAPPPSVDAVAVATATRVVPTSVFLRDVQALAGGLNRFGTRLQRASAGPAALRRHAPALRRDLAQIRAAGRRMATYRLASAPLERRRRAMVPVIPRVVTLGTALIDAALAGDAATVRRVAARFTRQLDLLRRAATGS